MRAKRETICYPKFAIAKFGVPVVFMERGTSEIKKLAKLEDLKLTPDNMGYYKYIDSYKAYLEIIPYNKLIQDSQKRNKILFDKLFNQI